MKAKYTPAHVANFILKRAKEENIKVTQLKLLKLVYLLYGWVLAVLDKKLFDEPIHAWQLGPVIPSLYHEFKRFGSDPIDVCSVHMDKDDGRLSTPFITDDKDIITVMEKAWDTYSPFTAAALVNKTHEPDSPWVKHYKTKHAIPDDEIKVYFSKKIREYLDV